MTDKVKLRHLLNQYAAMTIDLDQFEAAAREELGVVKAHRIDDGAFSNMLDFLARFNALPVDAKVYGALQSISSLKHDIHRIKAFEPGFHGPDTIDIGLSFKRR